MRNGWLNREGKFFECCFGEHAEKATDLEKAFNFTDSLECLGWIKVHECGQTFFSADTWYNQRFTKPTRQQIHWLRKNGYENQADHYMDIYYS